MSRSTTLNLPDKSVPRVKATADDLLLAYSQGRLSRSEAIRALGLRDYAELLVTLGDADLPMPLAPPHDVANEAAIFEKIWR
jgi:hypothetical protein